MLKMSAKKKPRQKGKQLKQYYACWKISNIHIAALFNKLNGIKYSLILNELNKQIGKFKYHGIKKVIIKENSRLYIKLRTPSYKRSVL
jgi:hypothetical protein